MTSNSTVNDLVLSSMAGLTAGNGALFGTKAFKKLGKQKKCRAKNKVAKQSRKRNRR